MPTDTEKPTVQPTDDVFEVEIPDGLELTLPGDEPADKADKADKADTPEASEPAAKAEEKPEKKPEAKTKPEKKPAAKDERLHPAVREERAKRKEYARMWEEAEADKERLERELAARRGQAPVNGILSKEERAALKERANKADSMGELAEIFLEQIDRRDQLWGSALNEERFNRHLQICETAARRDPDMPGYDLVLKEAGIVQAVKVDERGMFADPGIARSIYTKQDPAAAAYALACGKLEKEGRLDEVLAKVRRPGAVKATEEIELDDAPPADDDRQPEKKPTAKAKETEAESERRAGAREVIEKVSGNSSKPRGLSAVKPATPPKRGLTRDDLDRMSDENPEGLDALFKANPKLKVWWLSGISEAAG